MSTETQATGGFLGDPAEALNPPATANGCCGTPASVTGAVELTQASTCCGTATEAESGCCGSAAQEQAAPSKAGCCG